MIKKQVRKVGLLILTIFFVSSCGTEGINFDPKWYVPSVDAQYIINREGQAVYFSDRDIEQYACLSKDKIKELAEILSRARIPKELKAQLLQKLKTK